MSLEGFSLTSKGWCCIGPDLYLLLFQSQMAPYSTCQDHQPAVFLTLSLSCRCLGSCQGWVLCHPSHVSSFIPAPETCHEGEEIAFALIWTPLGSFLSITAGSHCPHKAPSKTLQAVPPFPSTQQCSHLSSLLDQATSLICPCQHHRVTWLENPWSTVWAWRQESGAMLLARFSTGGSLQEGEAKLPSERTVSRTALARQSVLERHKGWTSLGSITAEIPHICHKVC